jgi:hypothetical protein
MNRDEAVDKIIETLPVSEMGKVRMGIILEQYAQQISKGAVTDYAKFINPDGYKRDIVIFNLGRLR